jgi:Ca2+-binding EF-hand superfamily protein
MTNRRLSVAIGCGVVFTAFACSHQPAESHAPNEGPKLTPAAGPATPRARPGCADNFKAFDDNGDGRVSEEEFNAGPHAHPDPMAVFRGRDGDHDGRLTEAEFCSGFRGVAPTPSGAGTGAGPGMMGPRRGHQMRQHREPGTMMGARCEQHFETFDADHDGKLTRDEFGAWPHAHGDANMLFDERDLDHNGTVESGEFCSAWSGRPAR